MTIAGIASVLSVQAVSPSQYRVTITAHESAAKIYSANAATVGVPLRVTPPSVVAIWPDAQPFNDPEGQYSAYVHSVTGMLQTPRDFKQDVQIRYGVCHTVCVLEQVQVKLPQ